MFARLSHKIAAYLYGTPSDEFVYQVIKVNEPVFGLRKHQIYIVRRGTKSPYFMDRFYETKPREDVLAIEKRVAIAVENGELEVLQTNAYRK